MLLALVDEPLERAWSLPLVAVAAGVTALGARGVRAVVRHEVEKFSCPSGRNIRPTDHGRDRVTNANTTSSTTEPTRPIIARIIWSV